MMQVDVRDPVPAAVETPDAVVVDVRNLADRSLDVLRPPTQTRAAAPPSTPPIPSHPFPGPRRPGPPTADPA